jgi:OOP family OmpA-OmpF porin
MLASAGLALAQPPSPRPPPPPPPAFLDPFILFFETGEKLAPSSATLMDNVVASVRLMRSAQTVVRIAGHTDELGSNEANHRLGCRRAKTVKRELVARGLAGTRIIVTSYGEARPLVMMIDAAGQAQNRRAELLMFPSQEEMLETLAGRGLSRPEAAPASCRHSRP